MFAVTAEKYSESQGFEGLECLLYKFATRNWQETPEKKRKKVNTKVLRNSCLFRLQITRKKPKKSFGGMVLCYVRKAQPPGG